MPVVVVVVAGCKLEQPVSCRNVLVGVADDEVARPDIGGADRESQHESGARCDSVLYGAALSRGEVFDTRDPLVASHLCSYREVGRSAESWDTTAAPAAR